MRPLITVIIPIYNAERYLDRCLNSVIHQTYTNLEIILVDDGSTDDSGRICVEFAKTDTRINLIHKSNGGVSSARNAGLDIMHGKYIMFVDSDDYLALDCIEYLYDLLSKSKVQIAIGNYEFTKEDKYLFKREQKSTQYLSGKEAIILQFGKRTVQFVSPWAKLFQRELFDELRFPDGLLIDDEGTLYKVLYFCHDVVVSDRVVYAYYYNPDSLTKKPQKKNYEDLCTVLKEQIQFYHEHGETTLEARVRNRYCIQAAAHYMPKGYFEHPHTLVQEAKKMYCGIWGVKEIPIKERVKGWLCANFCAEMAHVMGIKGKIKERIALGGHK